MWTLWLLVVAASVSGGYTSFSHGKEHFLSDAILRELVDKMGKDLADAENSYSDFPIFNSIPLDSLMAGRSIKDLDNEEQLSLDYDPLAELGNPNPSIRDQEYLQHSSLWGHQYMTGGAGEGQQRMKPNGSLKNQQEVKSDAALPAYCNPPNPCPVGYTAEEGCTEDFENSAAFSRDYQAAQDCMCDSEHMFDCPASNPGPGLSDPDIDRIMEQLRVDDQHKNLVAKKFHVKKDSNPFLKGEKLPVAAKKGNGVTN